MRRKLFIGIIGNVYWKAVLVCTNLISWNINFNNLHVHSADLWCPRRGVAARALHLSRGVEKPSGRVTYIVVLEGLCRFNVQELSTRGTYYTARIMSLDMTKTGKIINPFVFMGNLGKPAAKDPDRRSVLDSFYNNYTVFSFLL